MDCEKLLDVTSLMYCCGDADTLRKQLLQSLQRLIPHELGACHWIQPSRHEIAAWYEPKRRPLPVSHENFWRLIDTHPLNRVLFSQPPRAWRLSDVMPRRAFRATELYTTLYRPLHVDCELTVVFPDKQTAGKYFLVSLHRNNHDFTERERDIVNLLLPHIARAQSRLSLPAQHSRAILDDATQFQEWIRQHTTWTLSNREIDVLFWLAQGKTNDEIGAILGIAGRTAETHALRLYPKIGVENRYSAITTVAQLTAHPLARAVLVQ